MRPADYRRTVRALVTVVLADAAPMTCDEATHGESGSEVCGRPVTHVVDLDDFGRMPACARCATYYHGKRRPITDADRIEIMAAELEHRRGR